MAEQLSMFANTDLVDDSVLNDSLPLNSNISEETDYEALDYQLADLMVELNDFVPEDEKTKKALNKTLRDCTLEISKNTREGQISKRISKAQQATLLLTTVVGEVGKYMPLVIERCDDCSYLYLNRYWQYQQALAKQINARIQNKDVLDETQQQWAQTRLADYFKDDPKSTEINWQKRAAELALQNKFLIISGGPGTGKTTTITRLLALLIEQQLLDVATKASANNADIIELDVSNNETASSLSRDMTEITLEQSDDDPKGEIKSSKTRGVSFNILLAAPTGKAAIRMLDSIREASNALQNELNLDDDVLNQLPTEANTIHKLLGYKHNSAQFKHNKNNPLNTDIVLIDEVSMVDISLMSKLFDAVPEHAKLILIGDKDQLASVETGSVFADMCEGLKARDNLITLKKNWRFAADSDIGQAAIAANNGNSEILLEVLKSPSRTNAKLILPNDMRDADLVKPWVNYFDVINNPESSLVEIFAAFNQYRVLCALRRGFNGSEIMNNRIETALEKQSLIQRRRSTKTESQYSNWYHGKPIMISQNSYNKGLMNGDTGITLIRNGEINVYFPNSLTAEGSSFADGLIVDEGSSNKYQSFSPVRLPTYETTWAMTIHKSQGSEFERVVLILPQEEMPLLTRQLIYTGITRAKQQVSIVASENVLMSGVKAEVVKATRIASLSSLGGKEVVD